MGVRNEVHGSYVNVPLVIFSDRSFNSVNVVIIISFIDAICRENCALYISLE